MFFSFNKITKIDALDGLKKIPDNSINTIVTSPPYNKGKGLFKHSNQMWNVEIDYDTYDDNMNELEYQEWQVKILNECFRILKPDGSMFYNHKARRLDAKIIIPELWLEKTKFKLHQKIIWDRKATPNVANYFLMPTTEYFYWLSKGTPKVFLNNIPKEYSGNIWEISALQNKVHPAPFHPLLPELCILLTTEENDVILDPFNGIGSSTVAAKKLKRNFAGFDISDNYIDISNENLIKETTVENYVKRKRKIENIVFNNKKFVNFENAKQTDLEEFLNNENIYQSINLYVDENINKLFLNNILEKCFNLLEKNGSLFLINKNNNYSYKIFNEINNSKFNLYQDFFIKYDLNHNDNNKLNDNNINIFWCYKDKTKKHRNNLNKDFKKEVWNLNDENTKEYINIEELINNELKNFSCENDEKQLILNF